MNLIKQGDSLSLLDEVEDQSIQTIYFDPPFNTQRMYALSPDDKTGFSDIWESNQIYIDFVEPLVKKCKKKLKKDGTFFFHISSEEMMIPQMICNKHFKRVQPIFWKKSRSKNNVKRKLGTAIDIIFMCTNSSSPKFNMVYQELNSYYVENSYKNKDERGNYALGHIVYTATQKTQKEERLYAFEHNGVVYSPSTGWRLSKDKLEEMVADNRIHFPKKEGANPYKKIYMHESKGKPCMDLWDDIHSIAQGSERRLYPTEKPEKLLERIIEMSSDEGDIVLDPVAGSGTSGVVAKRMGRNYILFDINPDAVKIAKSRIFT
jgi:DNA modification methylase